MAYVLSLFSRRALMAILASVAAFVVINLIGLTRTRTYPLLLCRGHWFLLTVVLAFTVIAAGSTALLRGTVREWPVYQKYPILLKGGLEQGPFRICDLSQTHT